MSANCEVCGKTASKRCSGCHNVSYCSVDHQKSHWKAGHKRECKVYVLKRNDIMGRYIIAGKDIPAGTVIMDEPALVIGPKQDSVVICLGCHKRVDGSYHCSKCGLPVCDSSCEKVRAYSDIPCIVPCTDFQHLRIPPCTGAAYQQYQHQCHVFLRHPFIFIFYF
jgi:hypothetical protein